MRSRLANALVARPLRQSRGWVCKECFLQSKIRWQSSEQGASALNLKPYYITSPIFYVNAGKVSQAQGSDYKSNDMSCSTSRWSPLHAGFDGHSEEMACVVRPEVYTRYRHRRAWNESMLEGSCNQCNSGSCCD